MKCNHLNYDIAICECCHQYAAFSEKFGCHPVNEAYFSKMSKNETIDSLVDFVTKHAFEGLDYTDPYSIERAIKEWFNGQE